MDTITNIVVSISSWLWGPPMLLLLVGGGLWMTIALDFVQFKHFPFIMRETLGKLIKPEKSGDGTITAFQATTSALANTVGASNIIGVPVAIALGGPGAIFWMWVSGVLGLAIKWAEIALSIEYREKDEVDGTFVGGPMYYLSKGLNAKWLGTLFAFVLMLELIPSVGSQAVAVSANAAAVGIPKIVSGVVVAIFAGLVVFGGIQRIGKVTEKLIPGMVILYLIVAWIIIALNIQHLPGSILLIFKSAFTPVAATGGFAGAGIAAAARWGVARGVYSNEAGMGQAGIAHAAAITDHPGRQGMWAMFEVVVDTFFVCSTTAFLTLTTGLWTTMGADAAATIPAVAIGDIIGATFAQYFVTFCLIFFVVSTVIGNCFYGEQMARYLFGNKFAKFMLGSYIAIVVIASTSDLATIYNYLDILLALVVIPNVIGVVLMTKKCREIKKDFFDNKDYVPAKK
ncbi:alanine/glycine:cation symporter family protein [Anaeromicrobium sediminis]|uniref:Sodium:alanine symporter family protein n=1 Tax=Anaeromicrobium sediminis TaxID=1478221 RepID=A0A267MMF9_9FIRM|nr:amino acid carrier protein [Anaeromicrobium sediminis]PAB60098.1 sodium:alanine symporter family protein [Anaeromicrobium sediminis]